MKAPGGTQGTFEYKKSLITEILAYDFLVY